MEQAMTSLKESLEDLLGAAIHNHADHRDVTKEVLKIIQNHAQPTNDVERVAGVIESHQHFLDDVAVEGDENEWNDALRQVAAKCIAALTQKHDTPPKGNTHENTN